MSNINNIGTFKIFGKEIEQALQLSDAHLKNKYGAKLTTCQKISRFINFFTFGLLGNAHNLSKIQKGNRLQLIHEMKILYKDLRAKSTTLSVAGIQVVKIHLNALKASAPFEQYFETLSDAEKINYLDTADAIDTRIAKEFNALHNKIADLKLALSGTSFYTSKTFTKLEHEDKDIQRILKLFPQKAIDFLHKRNCDDSPKFIDLTNMSKKDLETAIEDFQIQDLLTKVPNPSKAITALIALSEDDFTDQFIKFLATLHTETLKNYSLNDLKSKPEEFAYLFLTEAEFKKFTVMDLKDANSNQMKVIYQLLNDFDEDTSAFFVKNITKLPISCFMQLDGKGLNTEIKSIPPNIFSLFSDDQIKNLEVKQASREQLEQLIFFSQSNPDRKARYAVFSDQQSNDVIAVLGLAPIRRHLLTPSQMKSYLSNLDISKMSEALFKEVFPLGDAKENRLLFAQFSDKQVEELITKVGATPISRGLLSPVQLTTFVQNLDISKVNNNLYKSIFGTSEGKKHFELLSDKQVEELIEKIGLLPLTRNLLSPNQLKVYLENLDISKVGVAKYNALFPASKPIESKKRFALLKNEKVVELLNKISNPITLNLLSSSQMTYFINLLDTSKLTDLQYRLLFLTNNKKENLHRFALLSDNQVKDLIDKVGYSPVIRKLLSDTQLTNFIKSLDISKLPQKGCKSLFETHDLVENQKRLALLSPTQLADFKIRFP